MTISGVRRYLPILLVLLALLALWVWFGRGAVAEESLPPALRIDEVPSEDEFARAFAPRSFTFPLDHGPHLGYQTEWWYFTGNLESVEGRHYGYQLTFFRRGLSPEATLRESPFATNQVYFAHLALTDVEGDSHEEVERFSRAAADLAGARGEPFQVWLEDWRLESLNDEGSSLHLTAHDGDFGLDLELIAQKPIVAHGNGGLSPKSSVPGNASYYLSLTRLETAGTIRVGGVEFEVLGESWFDHEWSTSALGENAQGWDWFGLQLSDGRDVMLALIRNTDGTIDQVSGGTLVEADGKTRSLDVNEFAVQVLDHWQSPDSGAEYPSSWRITIPSADLQLTIEPWLRDQEMSISLVYWEGAVSVSGSSKGIDITGNGYVELTGYAQSFQGVF
jgi:predicted secreted hydrolase